MSQKEQVELILEEIAALKDELTEALKERNDLRMRYDTAVAALQRIILVCDNKEKIGRMVVLGC